MNKRVFLLVFLAAAAVTAQTNSQSADQREITALEQQMVQMDIKGENSPQFIDDHISPSFMAAWPLGVSTGREHFTDTVPGQQILGERHDSTDIKIFGDTAVVQGKWWKRAKENGKVGEFHGFFQDVWIKQNGKWQLVASAAGPLAPPMPNGQSSPK